MMVDDRLPVAGILSQLPENWPSIVERDGFVDVVTEMENLSTPESAVHRRITFRAGSASQGCWESLGNMARYLGGNERTILRAISSPRSWASLDCSCCLDRASCSCFIPYSVWICWKFRCCLAMSLAAV